MPFNLITILGPTATGKTGLAVKLANNYNGEIISADSRQVYKRMNIGTGKDLAEYSLDGNFIKYHLIDVTEPHEEFNLFLFKKFFNNIFEDISRRKKVPFLVGGTGLYLSSILQDYSLKIADFASALRNDLEKQDYNTLLNLLQNLTPTPHNQTDATDKERLIKAIIIKLAEGEELKNKNEICSLTLGIYLDRDEIKRRINERLKKRFDEGMIDEVKSLVESGVSFERLNSFGLEYRYISLYLRNELNFNDMFQKLNSAINNFAKRQMTWFRKMEREGVKINWITGADYSAAEKIIDNESNN